MTDQLISVLWAVSTAIPTQNFHCNAAGTRDQCGSKGGLNENQFSISAYANHLRRSRMALNFSRPVFDEPNHHCKGRTIETTLCGALLIEQENPETKKWFRPGIDYVSFTDERDLVAK